MGGVENGARNLFEAVEFLQTDLRRTGHFSADMSRCVFVDAKLDAVDFAGTRFSDCRFEGEMVDVVFRRQAFQGESLPPNEMKNLSFRDARFEGVEFRGLEMEGVEWPVSSDHYVIANYPEVLDRLIRNWELMGDVVARQLGAAFGVRRKFITPSQHVGVVSERDLLRFGEGPAGRLAIAELRQMPDARRSV